MNIIKNNNNTKKINNNIYIYIYMHIYIVTNHNFISSYVDSIYSTQIRYIYIFKYNLHRTNPSNSGTKLVINMPHDGTTYTE